MSFDLNYTCSIGPETVDLLDKLLVCNPRDRLTASQALDHDYFWTDPLPADPKSCVSFFSPLLLGLLIDACSVYSVCNLSFLQPALI